MNASTERSTVRSARGMVASSHRDVSAVGAQVLADGGTAMDATLAMAAMSFVCLPGQCGLGGDAFAVWFDATSGSYHSVQGSGPGPDGADVGFFRTQGLTAIPLEGPLSVAVPGAVAAMQTLHRTAASRPLLELWGPAIDAARAGVVITEKTHEDIATNAGKISANAAASRLLLPGGSARKVGETMAHPDLANAMERLAERPQDFYTGELADACLTALVSAGAPFSRSEWQATAVPVTPPVSGTYHGQHVYQCRPPSPGYMVLQQAALLEPLLRDLPWLSAEAVHRFARAAQRCFADRLAFVGSDTNAWMDLLDARRVEATRRSLDDPRAVSMPMAGGDTTSFVAVDGNGNAVSFIHSLAFTFGSGFLVPGTGIFLNDRLGRGAYLDGRHPNGLRPGRLPMHTLNTWITADVDGGPRFVGNTPGGDGQVQWNMQMLSHLIDHALDPQQAVDAPRFSVYPGSDADALTAALELRVESRLPEDTISGLRRRGHRVVVQGPWDGGGSGQIIARAADGELVGGSDARFDGAAVGV